MAETTIKTGNKTLASTVGAACAAILVVCVPKFEGTVLRGYKDPIGIVTACSGHTKTAVLGRPYTVEECNKLLMDDLLSHAEGVKKCLTYSVKPHEMAAFVSFTYNVGVGAFCGSTMVKKANAGDLIGACNELPKWVYAGSQALPGLVTRRRIERDICLGIQK